MKSVVVVLPTKNEEPGIAQVISEVKSVFAQSQYSLLSIIVVDDSQDNTALAAKKAGAEVMSGGGRGLGHAVFKGLKRASQTGADYILTLDGDGQTEMSEVHRFLKALEDGRGDLILASRFRRKDSIKYKYPLINRLGVCALVKIINLSTGLKVTDSHGGIRAMRRAVAEKLEMVGHYTYVQETIIDAVEKGFRVFELESDWKPREHGQSAVVSSIPKYAAYTTPVLVYRGQFHVRWMLPVAIFLCLAGGVLLGSAFFIETLQSRWILLFSGISSALLGFISILFVVVFELLYAVLKELRSGG